MLRQHDRADRSAQPERDNYRERRQHRPHYRSRHCRCGWRRTGRPRRNRRGSAARRTPSDPSQRPGQCGRERLGRTGVRVEGRGTSGSTAWPQPSRRTRSDSRAATRRTGLSPARRPPPGTGPTLTSRAPSSDWDSRPRISASEGVRAITVACRLRAAPPQRTSIPNKSPSTGQIVSRSGPVGPSSLATIWLSVSTATRSHGVSSSPLLLSHAIRSSPGRSVPRRTEQDPVGPIWAQIQRNAPEARGPEIALESGFRPPLAPFCRVVVQAVAGSSPVAHRLAFPGPFSAGGACTAGHDRACSTVAPRRWGTRGIRHRGVGPGEVLDPHEVSAHGTDSLEVL